MNALSATSSYAGPHWRVSESHWRCSNASRADDFCLDGNATRIERTFDASLPSGNSSGNVKSIHPNRPRIWSSYFLAVTSLIGAS